MNQAKPLADLAVDIRRVRRIYRRLSERLSLGIAADNVLYRRRINDQYINDIAGIIHAGGRNIFTRRRLIGLEIAVTFRKKRLIEFDKILPVAFRDDLINSIGR